MPRDSDFMEEKILQFVKDNPGKSKSDVVRYLKDRHIAARIATLAHIDRLEGKKMIICQLENPNSQIYKIYINKDNILSSVIVELEEFKEAYLNLLEKSKEKINSRQYSINTEALGIKENDPAKWSYEEVNRYREFWDNKMEEKIDESMVLDVELDRLMKEGKELKNQTLMQMQVGNKDQVLQNVEKYESIEREQRKIIAQLHIVMGSQRENILLLFLGPVKLFYVVVDIMFFRSMVRWQEKISDKEILSQAYSIVYKKISEIQFELSKFFQSIELGQFEPIKTLVDGRYETEDMQARFWVLVSFYYQINMGSEIRRVIDSITKLKGEIRDLNLFGLSLDYYPPDMLENQEKEIRKDMVEMYKLAWDIRRQDK